MTQLFTASWASSKINVTTLVNDIIHVNITYFNITSYPISGLTFNGDTSNLLSYQYNVNGNVYLLRYEFDVTGDFDISGMSINQSSLMILELTSLEAD